MDTEDTPQEEEPSILEYARYHKIVSNHLAVNPLDAFAGFERVKALEDDSDLPGPFGKYTTLPPERLTFNRDVLEYLSEVCKEPPEAPSHPAIEDSSYRRMKDLKVETPLLFTDHELDMESFGRPISPNLKNLNIEPIKTDDEENEALKFPAAAHKLASKLADQTESERLTFSKESLEYLQNGLKCPEVDCTVLDSEANQRRRERNAVTEPISSPLLPMSPELKPFVPSSETGRLELLSEHTNHYTDELRELEQEILQNDSILPKVSIQSDESCDNEHQEVSFEKLGDVYTPLKDIEKTPPSNLKPRRRGSDLKVESPLTLALWVKKPSETTTKEKLGEILLPELPLPIHQHEGNSSDDIDQLFTQTLQPFADKANNLIEHEQLHEADATARVKVPALDLSPPPTPWDTFAQESKSTSPGECMRNFLCNLKETHLADCEWPLSLEAQRQLQWAPFSSSLARVRMDEDIPEDHSLLAPWIAEPAPYDLSVFAWKLEGLRILDDDSDDGEIEEARFPESSDLVALIRKRKRELETHEGTDEAKTSSHMQNSNQNDTSYFSSHQVGVGPFSAMTSIDDFMIIRTAKIKKPKRGQDIALIKDTDTAIACLPTQENISRISSDDTSAACPPIDVTALLPDHALLTTACTFIISSTLLNQLKLVRMMHELYPKSEFVERDFNLHTTLPTTTSNKLITSNALVSHDPISHEADILLSPGTGLILTTLQKLHQRPLPGAKATASALHTRISLLAPRYTALLILVSQNQAPGTPFTPLGPSDCAAIAELIAFTHCSLFTSLETEVQTIFVPNGEKEVAHWAVSLMSKYGVEVQNLSLLQDETTWEVWLRRAGMNAFAAQAILAELRAPEGENRESNELWGLPAFVMMGEEERLRRFTGLMGGEGVLRRAGRVLDAAW